MRYKKYVALFDNHGDMMDQSAFKAAKEFIKYFKPDIRIHGGDCFDLRCMRKGAGKDEEFEDLKADIDAGVEFLSWLKPKYWLRGNHDERLIDATDSPNPVLRRFACMAWQDIIDRIPKTKILPYDKYQGILKLGHLSIAHGFASGIYAARTMATVYGNILFGHVHFIDAHSIAGLEPRVGWACGCMCKLQMGYNRAQIQTLRQCHGFAYGFLYEDGTFLNMQARSINGSWLFPTEFKEIHCA